MSILQDQVRSLVAREGFVVRHDHPELQTAMDALLRSGQLRQVLVGVYTAAAFERSFEVRVRALAAWAPDAVLVGATSARLSFWPACPAEVVECALRRRGAAPGYRFSRRSVPAELVMTRHGLRLTAPALTVLDLSHAGTDAIDIALRTRSATLEGMREALRLTPGRRGNQVRLTQLLDSRDEPWSAAERLAHRLLREAGISGWRSNFAVRTAGRLFYVDIAFPGRRVAVEIDGRLHELDQDVFENDRWRQNALVLDGWTVLRFTWAM
ncbi:MAG: DUF559 domain-containing protein, partial [Propionibacteriaceae bacterium]